MFSHPETLRISRWFIPDRLWDVGTALWTSETPFSKVARASSSCWLYSKALSAPIYVLLSLIFTAHDPAGSCGSTPLTGLAHANCLLRLLLPLPEGRCLHPRAGGADLLSWLNINSSLGKSLSQVLSSAHPLQTSTLSGLRSHKQLQLCLKRSTPDPMCGVYTQIQEIRLSFSIAAFFLR